MKKIAILSLILILLLTSISCNDNQIKDSSVECTHSWTPATCQSPQRCIICNFTVGTKLEHDWIEATCQTPQTCSMCQATQGGCLDHDVEKGHCSMCNLDYYDELLNVLKNNSTKYTNGSRTYYCYEIKYKTYGSYTLWVRYEEHNDVLYLMCFEGHNGISDPFMLFIDKAGVKKQSYEWEAFSDYLTLNMEEISGTLDATQFSKNTGALEYTNSTFNKKMDSEEKAQEVASCLELLITHAFTPLLEKSEHNLTPSHYGFEHFE